MTNINLNKHLLVLARTERRATIKNQNPKGERKMRTSTDDLLFDKKTALTIDSQIELYTKNNTDAKPVFEETPENSGCSVEVEKFFEVLENKLKKTDKKASSESFFEYVRTPDETDKFIKHLMKPLKRISPEDKLILSYFLEIGISYTVKFAPPDECNLQALLLLAITLREDTTKSHIDDPLFDIFIKNDLSNDTDRNHSDLILYYNRFCAHRNQDTPEMILDYVIKIIRKFTPYTKV